MKKLLGMSIFLLILYGIMLTSHERAGTLENHKLLAKDIGYYGILSLGAGILIIAGGIDLSMGSVVGLTATLTVYLAVHTRMHPAIMLAAVLGCGAAIGLVHGLLVTKMRLQPFIVTLCGLFIYRGMARWLTDGNNIGFAAVKSNDPAWYNSLEELQKLVYRGEFLGVPKFFAYFVVLSLLALVFLHLSVHGRYLFAIGNNERAARYSGISSDRYKILAYVLCSAASAMGGFLYVMEHNSVTPSSDGNFFELYAIAGAVVGGFSLRGGEGSIPGVLIGSSILWILPNMALLRGFKEELKPVIIGGVLLLGAILDELLRPDSIPRRVVNSWFARLLPASPTPTGKDGTA